MTIVGSGFPSEANAGFTATVAGTPVDVLEWGATQIKIRTKAFTGASPKIQLAFNGKTAEKTFTGVAAVLRATQISPTTYSPVLKTTLTITFTNSGADLVKENLSAEL